MSPFVRDVYTTESNQQLVWVAAARKRNDPTRPMMECMRVEAEEPVPVFSEAEYYRVTCTDGRRLHQARLPATFMPQCMRVDAATFKVLSATTKRLSVIMGKYGGDWINWKRLMPEWEDAGEVLPAGLTFYDKKGTSGPAIGRFLRSYSLQTGNAMNADLIRDLWADKVAFDVRTKPGEGPAVFRNVNGRVTLTAMVMPLIEAGA